MNTLTIKTKPCWHCGHLIDLGNDEYQRIDTLDTIVLKKEKEYVHTLCETKAKAGYARDDAASDFMDDREEDEAYADSLTYYEVLNGNY